MADTENTRAPAGGSDDQDSVRRIPAHELAEWRRRAVPTGVAADDNKANSLNSSRSSFDSADESTRAPDEQQAYDMGAKGGPVSEHERLLFEAWMRGHCWALCATWDGKQYRSDAEQGGEVDPRAMATRRLWAAWRDRAALSAPPSGERTSAPAPTPAPGSAAAPFGMEPDDHDYEDLHLRPEEKPHG